MRERSIRDNLLFVAPRITRDIWGIRPATYSEVKSSINYNGDPYYQAYWPTPEVISDKDSQDNINDELLTRRQTAKLKR